jgi:hypothetical protein
LAVFRRDPAESNSSRESLVSELPTRPVPPALLLTASTGSLVLLSFWIRKADKPMTKQKGIPPAITNNEIRTVMLHYFYERNRSATSSRGKKGSSAKISDVKRELKASHGLSQQEVQSNLTYLISQGWVNEDAIEKSFTAPSGTIIPSTTNFYTISAAGIDKIEGPGEFTMPKFHGIKIEATGQNIITLGDGNQVDAKFGDLGQSLAELGSAITTSDVLESTKLEFVADIDTIQSQLAKPEPNPTIIKAAWEVVKGAATINSCTTLVAKVGGLLKHFL